MVAKKNKKTKTNIEIHGAGAGKVTKWIWTSFADLLFPCVCVGACVSLSTSDFCAECNQNLK